MKHVGRRDDYVTATGTVSNGTMAYDDDGKLVTTGARETYSFWADIEDMKSRPQENPLDPGRRDTRRIKITADSRDVADITTDFTLTYGGSTDVFSVMDRYDSDFRFTTELIAEQTR